MVESLVTTLVAKLEGSLDAGSDRPVCLHSTDMLILIQDGQNQPVVAPVEISWIRSRTQNKAIIIMDSYHM